MQDRAEKLRQCIARFEHLAAGAARELAAVYEAEMTAARAMLAKIEQDAKEPSFCPTDPTQSTNTQGHSPQLAATAREG